MPAFEMVHDDAGDLGLLGVVKAAAVNALPIGVIRADNDLDDGFTIGSEGLVEAVVLDPDLVTRLACDEDRFIEQVRDPMRLCR